MTFSLTAISASKYSLDIPRHFPIQFRHFKELSSVRLPSVCHGSVRWYREGRHIFGNSGTVPSTAHQEEAVIYQARQNGHTYGSVGELINAYRRFGYLRADLDPLKLWRIEDVPELNPELYGFGRDTLEEPLNEAASQATVGEFIAHLSRVYSGQIAVEFMHLNRMAERKWFAEKFENLLTEVLTVEERIGALKVMLKARTWEHFIAQKFPTLKRYSGEGAESALAIHRCLIEEAPNYDIQQFIFDGAHRGRLALQTTLFQFPVAQLFRKIRGKREFPENVQGGGDVLTHQHSHFDYKTEDGAILHVSTVPNPSHLEVSLPLAVGKARGRAQTLRLGDYGSGIPGDCILSVHHHGDGAFTGQGIVWETVAAMSQVPHFRIGGSIHVIVNNQVAFTAEKGIGRSSLHVSDIAKSIDSPVIHVNGDAVDKAILAAKLALAYRDRFRKEVFINLVCCRKYGHNELDDPSFTQPLMYKVIAARKCLVDSYAGKLTEEGVLSREETENIAKEYAEYLQKELKAVDEGGREPIVDHLKGNWTGFRQAPMAFSKWDTGFDTDALKIIGAKSVECPEGFNIHPHLKKMHVDGRLKRLDAETVLIDWSTAEAMAFGSILSQGFDIRLSGQDVGRATFSHRHAMLVDQETDAVHIPLNNLREDQKNFIEIANSPLTEAAVLGFEYGFAIENPHRLVIWEAQFGDFYNAAQVQIDSLIATGESKWLHQNGLVIMLPHGIDGMGPDHSSAHVERFLQLTDSREDQTSVDGDNVNMYVANPTTSAQYFHLLRRQIITPYRKPLILISPKLLLRHPSSASDLADFRPGTFFRHVLLDPSIKEPAKVNKIVFVSGKHAVILAEERQKRGISDVAIIRLEGICPFPVEDLEDAILHYPKAKKFIWSQEEPRNAGCWSFVQPRFKNAFGITLTYAGRPELAWMASAVAEYHKRELDQLIEDTFNN